MFSIFCPPESSQSGAHPGPKNGNLESWVSVDPASLQRDPAFGSEAQPQDSDLWPPGMDGTSAWLSPLPFFFAWREHERWCRKIQTRSGDSLRDKVTPKAHLPSECQIPPPESPTNLLFLQRTAQSIFAQAAPPAPHHMVGLMAEKSGFGADSWEAGAEVPRGLSRGQVGQRPPRFCWEASGGPCWRQGRGGGNSLVHPRAVQPSVPKKGSGLEYGQSSVQTGKFGLPKRRLLLACPVSWGYL